MTFDFGTNEEAAQQARHRLDGWKQAFRLDKKLQLKFERKETEVAAVGASSAEDTAKAKSAKAPAKGKAKSGAKSKSRGHDVSDSGAKGDVDAAETPAEIRMIVRLDFSDHEKLSYQRWIERIPVEEPFKTANPKVIRAGEPDFQGTSDLFDSLD